MPAGPGRSRLLVSVLAVALLGLSALLAGCSADAGPSVRSVAVMTRSGCPTDYPVRLTLTTSASGPAPSLHDLRGCTSNPRTGPVLFYNGSHGAWTTLPGGHAFRVVGGDLWTRWLRAHVAVPSGIVLPGESALVWGPADDASWSLARGWSVAWTSLMAGVQVLPAHGTDSRAAAARTSSVRGRSLVSCALTSLHLLRTASLAGGSASVVPPPPTPTLAPASPYGSTAVPAPTTPTDTAGSTVPGLTGLDALQATWSPSPSACATDWEDGDRQIAPGSGTPVRWWSAWQRAKDWLSATAGGLQWLDDDHPVVVRTRS